MKAAFRIQPQKLTSQRGASSRRQKPFTKNPKKLLFENPEHTILRNALGERFTLSVAQSCGIAYDVTLKSKDRETGELIIKISISADKEKNKVCISSITSHTPKTLHQSCSKPSRENRGFGIVRLALHFAKKLAKEQGITRITIQPYCRALENHYINSGFNKSPVTDTIKKHELVMELKN